jgi:hypothetical protein
MQFTSRHELLDCHWLTETLPLRSCFRNFFTTSGCVAFSIKIAVNEHAVVMTEEATTVFNGPNLTLL